MIQKLPDQQRCSTELRDGDEVRFVDSVDPREYDRLLNQWRVSGEMFIDENRFVGLINLDNDSWLSDWIDVRKLELL